MAISNYRIWRQGTHYEKPVEEASETPETKSSCEVNFAAKRRGLLSDSDDSLPCVLFTAKASLEIVAISESITELLGLTRDAVIGRPSFWQETVVADDWPLFLEKLSELERIGAVSFVHRVSDKLELPVWITHSLRKVNRNGDSLIRGCLVPTGNDPRMLALDQQTISRFIHKLGNQFQLLNLVINSLNNSFPLSREGELLQDSLDKAIDLTRVFSDCNYVPSWVSEVQLLEVVRTVSESRISQFADIGVRLDTDLKEIPGDAIINTDPYLLEAALGHILVNALEASSKGGKVEFGGRLIADGDGSHGAVRLYVHDKGCGILASELNQVTIPFYSTKKGHEGLGLTVASRLIEMHGGALRINSKQGHGTQVEISLPLEQGRDKFCA